MKKYLRYVILGVTAILLSEFLSHCRKESEVASAPRDYAEILSSGVLRAVTEYNSLSFHTQGDTIEGLHYDLLLAFGREKGIKIDITPDMTIEKRTDGLRNGTYDLLANNVLITSDRRDSIAFTHPILLSKQVLVQRKPQTDNDSLYIRSQLELSGKTLHVAKGSPSIYRIHNLSNEIGDTIYIHEIDKYGPEQLLAMVAYGEIDYTVCDESIARTAIKELPILDIGTDISFTQFYSWAVNPNSPVLLDTLNAWIDRYKQTKEFRQILNKYSIR